jgi:hypothetical protein
VAAAVRYPKMVRVQLQAVQVAQVQGQAALTQQPQT